ncbi:MAG: signal peptidase I [Bacteroidetes bacterium]|nr:signal peptidase I [Bacteroidota bacterium]
MASYQLYFFLILWGAAFLLTRIGLAVLFKKAGENPVFAFIPILSWWYWIKIVDRPKWYMIGMVIPCVNILFSFNITLDLLRSFGQNKFWQQLVGTVLTFIYLPYMAFQKDLKYLGGAGNAEWRKKNVVRTRAWREWADALLFALYVAGGMRALYFDLYQIPTPSMESNLMVGDFLVVSRAKVGMRIPMTPITIPVLAHKDLMGIKAYSDLVELPYMRLPGWYTVKNNDVIVFNWPADPPNAEGVELPVDKKDHYVKRCVGIPGDSLKVVGGQVYVNGKAQAKIGRQQKRYLLLMKEEMTQDFLLDHELGDYRIPQEYETRRILDALIAHKLKAAPVVYIYTWPENAAEIKNDKARVRFITEWTAVDPKEKGSVFPNNQVEDGNYYMWDMNDYGPIYLPKRGDKIQLNKFNWSYYKLAVNAYEKANVEFKDDKFYHNGVEIQSYTFKYGYYWMMGDNRYNSSDSRFWGYVPEDHVVGKPLFTFFSLKKVIGIDDLNQPKNGIHGGEMLYDVKGIRWNRIFRGIN